MYRLIQIYEDVCERFVCFPKVLSGQRISSFDGPEPVSVAEDGNAVIPLRSGLSVLTSMRSHGLRRASRATKWA